MGVRNASCAVIGAGDYIGSAIVRKFASEGYTVVAGRSIVLDRAFSTPAASSYAWDFNGNGIFGEATTIRRMSGIVSSSSKLRAMRVPG